MEKILVHSPQYNTNLAEYGIDKPFALDRGDAVLAQLHKDIGQPVPVVAPVPVSAEDILRVHTPDYLKSLEDENTWLQIFELKDNEYDPGKATKPLPALFKDIALKCGGTKQACELALQHRLAANLGGGYHHAFPSQGRGYCVLHDIAIAIRALQASNRVRRVMVIDVDFHQGDGTAVIFAGDPSVFTLSVHSSEGWPDEKQESDLDVEIRAEEQNTYLARTKQAVDKALAGFPADLVVFVAGSDAYEKDVLEGTRFLNLTLDQLEERDAYIIDACLKSKIPIAMVFAGGYGPDVWEVHYRAVRHLLRRAGAISLPAPPAPGANARPASQVGGERQGIKFGEFLAGLGALDPEELVAALLASKELGVPIGRTLVVRRLVSNEDLGLLLEFHGLYRRGLCEFEDIESAFHLCKENGWNVSQSLNSLGLPVEPIDSVRLGELLLAAELIEADQLNDALSLQQLCGLPLGRILCLHHNVPSEIIDAALGFQQSIRQKSVAYIDAVDKLKIMPLSLPPSAMKNIVELDLRDLLIASGIVSEGALLSAINFSVANNMLLEKVLVTLNIDQALISAAAGLGKLTKHGYLPAHQAVEFLQNLRDNGPATNAKPVAGDDGEPLTLHRFLMACAFLTPNNIRDLIKILMARGDEFVKVIDTPIRPSNKEDLEELVMNCFRNDEQLAAVLINMIGCEEPVINHAKNLVNLVSMGGATLEQALLSFASIRKDVATLEQSSAR